MKAEGLHRHDARGVRAARDHGVTQTYVQEMKQAGFASATLEDLVRAKRPRRHAGVRQGDPRPRPDRVTTLEAFVRLRDHGVRAAFVQELKAAGYDKLATEELVRLARSRCHRRLRPRPRRAGLQERPARGRRPEQGPRRVGRIRRRHEGARAQGPDAAARSCGCATTASRPGSSTTPRRAATSPRASTIWCV